MEHRTNPMLKDTNAPKARLNYLQFLRGYLRPYRLQLVMALFAISFTSVSVLGLGGALRYLVDEGLGKGNPHLLNNAFGLLMGVTVLLALASYSRFYLVSWIGERVVADIRRHVFHHITHLDIAFFETNRTGDTLSRLTTDTTLLQTVVGSAVGVAIRNSFLLLGGATLLLITSYKLTGFVFLVIPFVIVPIIILGRRVRQYSRDTQQKVADLSAQAEETLSGIRTIHALALADYENNRFGQAVQSVQDAALNRIRWRAFLTALVIMLVFGAVVGVLWVGGHDVLEGRMSAGQLSSFVFYAVLVASSTGAISEIIGDLQRAAGACERLMELLQTPRSITAPAQPTALPQPLRGEIVFENVTFNYPARPDMAALKNFSLHIQAGETVALVGPSGAGKSTVLQLLLRFYDPQEGAIYLDGINIKDFDPQVLRTAMGLVPQDPVIFSTNAWDNIRLGHITASTAEILNAAHAAAAQEFLEELPNGLDTYLGEKGVRLSGGQKQRIAIARAVVRNPRVLLLDEATSALDSENETRVQAAMEQLMQNRTSIVIAHRLSTVLNAHRIVVLEDGKVESIGTHQALLSQSPLYARLAHLQFGVMA